VNDTITRWAPTSVSALTNTSILVAAAGYVICKCQVASSNSDDFYDCSIIPALSRAAEGCFVGVPTLMGRFVFHVSLALVSLAIVSCRIQLGDGGTINSNTPRTVSGIVGAVISLAAGSDHTCAATASVVYCWGSNSYGQVNFCNHMNYSSMTHSRYAAWSWKLHVSAVPCSSCWTPNGRNYDSLWPGKRCWIHRIFY
jgi:hypothetical protein